MSIKSEVIYTTRGAALLGVRAGDDDQQPQLSPLGDILVSAHLPPRTEVVRLGNSYVARNTTGVAPLAGTIPTTTGGFSLWNGESGQPNPKSYVIDKIVTLEGVADATQQNQLSVWWMMNPGSVAAITAVAGAVASLSANKANGTAGLSRARIATGLTVVDNSWYPIGGSAPGSAAVAGGIWRTTEIDVGGMLVVPPGGMLSLQAVKLAATAAQMFYTIYWHEVPLTLG